MEWRGCVKENREVIAELVGPCGDERECNRKLCLGRRVEQGECVNVGENGTEQQCQGVGERLTE